MMKHSNCLIFVGLLLSTIISGSASEPRLLNDAAQNTVTPGTSSELRQALKKAVKGTIIILKIYSYDGPFELNQDGVTISGSGTTINLPNSGERSTALNINGKNCTVANIKIQTARNNANTTGINVLGSRNKFNNILVEGFATAVTDWTDGNSFSNISISNGHQGIVINGNGAQLDHILLENMTSLTSTNSIWGNNNTISTLTCDSCPQGLFVYGDYNRIDHVELRNTRNDTNYTVPYGIFLSKGIGNFIDFFKGTTSTLALGMGSSQALVKNSVFGTVTAEGTNHTLLNVDAGELLMIFGTGGGHRIIKTKAKRLDNTSGNVTFIQSTFQVSNQGFRDVLALPTILGCFVVYILYL